jgi:tetratricopeptide (TPR) repeat protein
VLWNRAVAYTARRQFLRALEDLNRIEDLDREFPVHNARGNVLMGLGRHGDAAEEYQRHLERHDNPTTRLNLAIAFQMMHRLDDAVEQYNRVLSAVPELAVAWNNRGLAHRMAGRLDLAIADYNRAVEIDGEHSPAYVNRAMLHRCNGEFEQALRDLEKAIQSEPLNAVAFRNRALVHLRLGSLDHATADYRSAVEIEPALAFSPA